MTRLRRCSSIVAAALALGLGAAACSSSDGGGAAPGTTTTTAVRSTGTTEGDGSTTTTLPADAASGDLDCGALLQEYSTVFDPDDLAGAAAFFQKYEPSMPDDVAAATERLAAAYEEAGDLGHMDMADVDLTADAQTFSDWTNDGCPAR